MSYTGNVSYSEMILLYFYANHLLQKKSVLWSFYLNVLKVLKKEFLGDVVTIVISHES